MTKHVSSSFGIEAVQVMASCKARASERPPTKPKLGTLTMATTPLEMPDGGA